MADRRYSNRNRRGQAQAAPETAFVETLIEAVGGLIGLAFKGLTGAGRGGASGAAKQRLAELQEHWGQVELNATQDATLSLAISEADKILDGALKVLGFKGETMADRLRAAESRFTADLYQSVWSAHKLRNALAHEVGARVERGEAARAITAFRTALYSLGVFE